MTPSEKKYLTIVLEFDGERPCMMSRRKVLGGRVAGFSYCDVFKEELEVQEELYQLREQIRQLREVAA
jgi:hypothetical protein